MFLFPDVTEILDDPDIGGSQSFVVLRTTRTRSLTSAQTSKVEKFRCTGNVQPAQAVDLQQMTEEDRQSPNIVIRSTFNFQMGKDGNGTYILPDEVLYNGKRWKINRVDDWSQWGFTTAWFTLRKDVTGDG